MFPNLQRFFLIGMGLLVAGVTPDSSLGQSDPSRPNIVVIMADDLGYECLAANGGTSYQTPVVDQLARDGVRFEHCYAQPICTPSRVKLMTGIYNVRNYEQFAILPTTETTFANTFRDAGYQTCIVGKWQLGADMSLPSKFGFDDYCLWHMKRRAERYPNPGIDVNGKSIDFKNGEYGPDVVSDHACKFIEDNHDRPFLLYYPMILTHCPFCPTPDSPDWDPTSKGSPTYKGDAKYFGDMVSYMDKTVGKVLNKIDSLGLSERTLVIFTGDNGTDTPVVSLMGDRKVIGSKGQTIDAGTRVPLIVSWPGKISAGKVSQDLVTFTDFYSTLCDAAGLETPAKARQDGQSFFPQLVGQPGTPRQWIYCFYARDGGSKGKEFTRNQRYKLYRNGKFFDVDQDRREKTPLTELNDEQLQVRAMLQEALDRYTSARPAAVAKIGDDLKAAKKKKQQEKARQEQEKRKSRPKTIKKSQSDPSSRLAEASEVRKP